VETEFKFISDIKDDDLDDDDGDYGAGGASWTGPAIR